MRRLVMLLCLFMLAPCVSAARTWYVRPDSTGDAPTIPAAADSAVYGDTILVAPGTYICPDNTDYSYVWITLGSGVSLIASAGRDFTTIIDQTATMEPHAVIEMFDAQDCLVKGFSFVREPEGAGQYFLGVLMEYTSDSFIDSCSFDSFGYGIWATGEATHSSTPHIRWCFFTRCGIGIESGMQPFGCPIIRFNTFDGCSWGIDCTNSAPYIVDNYIANCVWSGVYCFGQSPASLDRNVIINNGECGVYVDTDVGAEPVMTTWWLPQNGNSIYGNAEYDLYNAVEDQSGVVEARCTYWGSDCPDFSEVIGGPGRVNYLPWCDSTHTEEYSECPQDAATPSTWGLIKAMYR